MRRKLAERAVTHFAWRLLRVALKRLGIPWYWWPFMWVSRRVLERQLAKRGISWDTLFGEIMQALRESKHTPDIVRKYLELRDRKGTDNE